MSSNDIWLNQPGKILSQPGKILKGIEMQVGLKIKGGNGYGIQCELLRLNPRAWWEHLTSQLSWAAAWLLVTCISPVYLVVDEFGPCALRPCMIGLMMGMLTFFSHDEYDSTYRSWCYSREWVWNSRTKLCCIGSWKWNVSRVFLQEFDISYIMF